MNVTRSNPARSALAVVVVTLLSACGPNPGELGYLGHARFDIPLEGRASRMPIAEGVVVDLSIYDESGNCIDLFSLGACPDFETPFSLVSSNTDVVEVSLLASDDGLTNHRVHALRPGHVELIVKDAVGTFVDFLPLEVATPAMLAVTDMSYAFGWARALPSDIGVPTAIEVPLRIGVADLAGRMLLTGTTKHAHVDVREEAPGFAVGADEPEPVESGFGTVIVNGGELAELPAETPLGVVSLTESDLLRLRASEPGRIRVEIPTLQESLVPLSLRVTATNVSTGTLAIDVVESDLDQGNLNRALLCARHSVDGELQAGWPYDWQVPAGFTTAPVGHTSRSGGSNRCIVSAWDRSTSVDERSEVFRVSFGALSAEIPASLVGGYAE